MPPATPVPTATPTATVEAPGPKASVQAKADAGAAQAGRRFDVAVSIDLGGAEIERGTVTLDFPTDVVAFVEARISPDARAFYAGAATLVAEGQVEFGFSPVGGSSAIANAPELAIFTFAGRAAGVADMTPHLTVIRPGETVSEAGESYSVSIIIEPRPGVTATCFTTTSTLTWSDPAGLEVMEVERRIQDLGFVQIDVIRAGVGRFDDDNLEPVTKYEYKLVAKVEGGDTGSAVVACTTGDGRVPVVPAESQVSSLRTEAGLLVALVNWPVCSVVEWGEVVEQVPGTYVATAETWEATPDTPCRSKVTSSESHTFAVPNEATGSLIFEVWGERVAEFQLTSNEGDQISAPTLQISVGETTAEIAWDHDKANVDHFTLDRSVGNARYVLVQPQISAQAGSILDADLLPDTAYCWRVRAVSPRGTRSEASEICSQTSGVSRLVFATDRDGNSEIYSMLADGAELEQLTAHSGDDIQPVWSPDRSQIAFSSKRGGTWDIWVMDADGTNLEQLTTGGSNDWTPAWSPDGTRIAWSAFRDGDPEIYVMNADGSSQTRLTTVEGEDTNPTWSPDGSQIAFTSRRDRNKEIYVMNADGTDQVRLTTHPDDDEEPAWSPDGSRIAFRRATQILTMNATGGGELFLTASDGENHDPSWSRDGRKILFGSTRDGDSEIYVMNNDGADETALTVNTSGDVHPDW